MNELKFYCTNCGQHISCPVDYAGLEITCPSCRLLVRVPGAEAASAGTPAPLSSGPPRSPGAARTSGWAMASLICSLSGLLLGFLGTIPGIICALKANAELKRNPGLGGKGLATAGLVTGLVLSVLWIGLGFILAIAAINGFQVAKRVRPGARPPVARQAATQPRTQVEEQVEESTDAAPDHLPDSAGWTVDLEGVSVPERPVSGRVQGLTLNPNQVELDQTFGTLEFAFRNPRSGPQERVQLLSIELRFDQQLLENCSGRKFTVNKEGLVSVQPSPPGQPRRPSVRINCMETGKKPIDTMVTPYRYMLRLEFGQLKDGKLPGRIYLCVLDEQKSFVRGRFVANYKAAPSAASRAGQPSFFVHPEGNLPQDTTADAAGWTLDVANVTLPESPATGRIHGVAFKMDQALFRGAQLHLRQGAGFFPDREFQILLWDAVGNATALSGRTYLVTANERANTKIHVSTAWMEPGAGLPTTASGFQYVLRLEFGTASAGKLPGRIYLCVLDREKSFVRGKFTVNLQEGRSMPIPQRMPTPAVAPRTR